MKEWWHKSWFHRWLHRDYIRALEKAYSIMTFHQKKQMLEWTEEHNL